MKLIMVVWLAIAGVVIAETVGWRTDGTGAYPKANPPTEWGKGSNILWSTAITNWSNASVVLSKGRIFVCAEPATLVCLDAESGRILWERPNTHADIVPPAEAEKARADMKESENLQKEIGKAEHEMNELKKKLKAAPDDADLKAKQADLGARIKQLKEGFDKLSKYKKPPTNEVTGYACCTPVTDGAYVYAFFGNGVAVCYDYSGNRKWGAIVEKPTSGWGQSASPLLIGKHLLVLVNKLYALDTETGAVKWEAKSSQRWGSPVGARVGDVEVAVTPGGDVVRVSDGAVQASRVGELAFCAPVVKDGIAYFIQAGGKAVKMTAGEGGSVKTEVLWTTKPKDDRYYASPVVHDGLIYAVTQAGEFSVIDAGTGEVVHNRKIRLDATVYPSVTLAGNKIYLMGEGGTCVVLEAGREAKEIARNKFARNRSCPVFTGARMYLRALDKVYCIAKP